MAEPTPVVVGAVGIIQTPTPHVVQIEIVTPTSAPRPVQEVGPVEEPLRSGQVVPDGYTKQMIVGRFSNYWPPLGGTNCFSDCELFADGSRVDQAIAEGWRVVACPADWLLGTRFEWPPDSGHVWTCRDRGEDIYSYVAESGLVVYWFDFLSPTAFVDFGSYIQLQVWVPNERVVP